MRLSLDAKLELNFFCKSYKVLSDRINGRTEKNRNNN